MIQKSRLLVISIVLLFIVCSWQSFKIIDMSVTLDHARNRMSSEGETIVLLVDLLKKSGAGPMGTPLLMKIKYKI